ADVLARELLTVLGDPAEDDGFAALLLGDLGPPEVVDRVRLLVAVEEGLRRRVGCAGAQTDGKHRGERCTGSTADAAGRAPAADGSNRRRERHDVSVRTGSYGRAGRVGAVAKPPRRVQRVLCGTGQSSIRSESEARKRGQVEMSCAEQ